MIAKCRDKEPRESRTTSTEPQSMEATGKVRRALFPGSFNPFTIGHASIVERALSLFDEVVIAVGISLSKGCDEEHIAALTTPIKALYANNRRVTVVNYSTLTVDAARDNECCAIVRGVRSVADYEYEMTMADLNRRLTGIETVLLPALPEFACVSSSMVRELQRFGRDVNEFLPTQ